ncbi:MAG: type II toxin-antitoxin system RelE/ParE family toxin [Nautiliaceae bacterium]
MSYKIITTDKFMKKLAKLIKKNPELKPKIAKTLKLFENDINHPSLRFHKLKGELSDKYSVSVDMNYRIILEFIVTEKGVILLDIGSHDEVY